MQHLMLYLRAAPGTPAFAMSCKMLRRLTLFLLTAVKICLLCKLPKCAQICEAGMQIFVEIERARLTKQLAKLKEEEGKVEEAAEILQEVAVVSQPVLALGLPYSIPAEMIHAQ